MACFAWLVSADKETMLVGLACFDCLFSQNKPAKQGMPKQGLLEMACFALACFGRSPLGRLRIATEGLQSLLVECLQNMFTDPNAFGRFACGII